jgi:putative hemolysin
LEFIIIFLLFLINGFFSLSELALISARKMRLELMVDERKKGARYALLLQEKSENFLSAIQIGISFVSLITGFYGGASVAKYITPLFTLLNVQSPYDYQLAAILSILLITFFAIVIGELVPKSIALSNPEKLAVRVAPIIYYFAKFFYPLVILLSYTTKLINKMLGIKHSDVNITEYELRHLIKDASKIGVIEEDQNEIHENLFYFSDKKAKHIMTHRSEIEWVDINMPKDEFISHLLEFKNSKVLVCDKNLDDYLGVLTVKELLIQNYTQKEYKIEDLLEQPIVFPESVDAQDILNEFRKRQKYFCVIFDEFGTIEGIITLHDIFENIVGEIPEEEEIVEPDLWIREDKSILVNGDAPIEVLLDVVDGLELDFEEIDYSTVAGFVLDKIEKIPEIGDSFEFMGYKIEIVDIDHNRIDKLLFSKISED